MPQSLVIGAFVFGAVLLIIGLVGGGFKLFGAEMPGGVSDRNRVVAFVLGIGFIVVPLLAERTAQVNPPAAPASASTPAVPAAASAPALQPIAPPAAGPAYVSEIYYAEARCTATGAWGWSKAATVDAAVSLAVGNCVSYGGIPACCSNGTTWRRIQ